MKPEFATYKLKIMRKSLNCDFFFSELKIYEKKVRTARYKLTFPEKRYNSQLTIRK